MTNIDTQIIYDKNGNPIPQYLDVADKTGGSAGTMKPITKNSYPEIQDVNVTNQQDLPTDYPDVAVKQELELIKAQQQQILERLDEPIPTQLTGRIVEVTSGQNADLIDQELVFIDDNGKNFDARKYRRLLVVFHNKHNASISVRTQVKVGQPNWSVTILNIEKTLPAGAVSYVSETSDSDFGMMKPYITFRLSRTNAPTEGQVDYWFFGEER